MTINEFYERTGLKVNETTFNGIHNIYMATTMDKDDFCKMWKGLSKDAQNEMDFLTRQFANAVDNCDEWRKHFSEQCKKAADEKIEMGKFLADEAQEYSSERAREKAIELMGFKLYIGYKMAKGYGLWKVDQEQILEHLN